jgi:hypothetical protein
VVLLALRRHFRKSYRDFCEILEACTSLLEELGLKKVPHWTMSHKISKRARTRRPERLLLRFLDEARVRVLYLAVGSTGVQPHICEHLLHACARGKEEQAGRTQARCPHASVP